MNVEEFREYCLSFRGVREKMPFPNVADRYSRVNVAVFDFCCIKCDPDWSGELQARYMGIRPGWHMNKKYWISVYFEQDVPDSLIRELVKASYDLVAGSLTKKEREELDSL